MPPSHSLEVTDEVMNDMRVRWVRSWRTFPSIGLAVLASLAAEPAGAVAPDGGVGNGMLTAPSPAPTEPTVPSGPGVEPSPGTPFSPADRERRLAEKGLTAGSPVMIRIFKQGSELELWIAREGRFELFNTYRVCFWSGGLGPKMREGDRQAPEGFYSVGIKQLYPKGRRPRSFDIGYPNTFDRSLARTGSYILVHGGCSSTGCFAMTDPVMDEIYALSERALREGQDRIEVQVFPFRMSQANLAAHAQSQWLAFWLNLKEAYDIFERTHLPPRVSVCDRRYIIRESDRDEEVAAPPDNGAPTAFDICEDAMVGIVPLAGPEAERIAQVAARVHRVAMRAKIRRAAGRSGRASHAAVRRARVASHARRLAHQ
jgi:murein L,D-transpeptidase YafK